MPDVITYFPCGEDKTVHQISMHRLMWDAEKSLKSTPKRETGARTRVTSGERTFIQTKRKQTREGGERASEQARERERERERERDR